jgi:hypothetical protein
LSGLDRSRGGYGTKACLIAGGRGRPVAFALAPGQAHELPMAPGLLRRLPEPPLRVAGDRGEVRTAVANGTVADDHVAAERRA